jgi:ubiquitin carboxyl-terminal hydrolase 4/11/15
MKLDILYAYRQAMKTMQVYITPNILMFHLKRFKDNNKYYKSKLQTVVDFPLEGLDMSPYIQDSRIPTDFSVHTNKGISIY